MNTLQITTTKFEIPNGGSASKACFPACLCSRVPAIVRDFFITRKELGMENTEAVLARKRTWKRRIADNDKRALRSVENVLNETERFDPPPAGIRTSLKVILIGGGLLLVALLMMGCTPANAYTEQQAIRTIIGESANQGLIGMTAVAEVIRTRGSLKGLYGFKNPSVDKQPAWVWKMARKAWLASKTSNLTKGADHFENVKAFGSPSWAKNCVVTFKHKDHVFMKEVA